MATEASPQRLPRLNALADAAVLAGLFTILAFQEIRFEGYEAEKAALLIIVFGLLAATLLCRVLIQPALLRQIPWRQPVLIGVGGLALLTLITQLTALNPQISLFGTADRSQGAVLQIGYLLLFVQGIISAERWQKLLPPVLLSLALPLCLFAWMMQLALGIPRPGSMAGNANFLASWLILAFLVIGRELLASRNTTSIDKTKTWVWRGFLLAVLLMMMATLALTASRGAVLGLIAAVFVYGGLWAATQRKKRLLLIVTLVAAVGIGVYVAVGQTLGQTRPVEEVPRFFRFFEDFRIESWTGAHYLLFEYRQPLLDAAGSPDAFSTLRPLIGYGLDNIAYMQRIIDTVYQRVTYLNSFHNFLIDTLVMQGIAGLIAWGLIYVGAGYAVLRQLHLLPRRYLGVCALIFVASVPITIGLIGNVLWYVPLQFLLFLGAGLSVVVELWVWLLVVAWLQRDEKDHDEIADASAVKALQVDFSWHGLLLSVLVARWVDGQFGFVQVATEPLWWLLLGMLVAAVLPKSAVPPEQAKNQESAKPLSGIVWWAAAGFAGVWVLHGLGNALTSQFVGYSLGGEYVPLLLMVIVLAGLIGAYATDARPLVTWLPYVGAVLILWALTFAIKEGIVASASSWLDTTVIQPQVAPESLLPPFQLLALKGVLWLAIGWAVWAWVLGQAPTAPKRRNRRALPTFPMWMWALIVIFGTIGSGYYVADYAAATLHAAGKGFASVDSPKTYAVGLAAFAASAQAQPNRGQLWLEEAELAMKQVRLTNQPISPETAAEPSLQRLFAMQPYYHYTRLWTTFCENYPIARCTELAAYLPPPQPANE